MKKKSSQSTVGTLLSAYLRVLNGKPINSEVAGFYASLDAVSATAPTIAISIINEFIAQRTNIKLIASENFSSLTTQLAHGNLLTDKYAEGYPYHRYYAGCDNVDAIEAEAARLACELFDAKHAFVQPHSGADANLIAFVAVLSTKIRDPFFEKLDHKDPTKLKPKQWQTLRKEMHNQRLLGLDYYSGGHLTHGYRHNLSSQLFDTHSYSVDPETKLIDLDKLWRQVREVKPLILLAGYSAYPRKLDFAKMREMADEVGAVFMVDMAHFAGLVAGKVFTGNYDPVPYAHIVTSTTHKTLRGPRGGIILSTKEFAPWIDNACPSVMGGPLPHVMAAKAVAFREALRPEFREYAHRIVANAQLLATTCMEEGMEVLTNGTDNHLLLVDVAKTFGLTGRQAESALRACHITLNRNTLPFDSQGAWYTSGLRIGTPAVTTLGMGASEMKEIARVIKLVLSSTTPSIKKKDGSEEKSRAKYELDQIIIDQAQKRINSLLVDYPLYPELDIDLLKKKKASIEEGL